MHVYLPIVDPMKSDRELIEDLGGPTKVAKLLGYNYPGGVQRVQNWLCRGIPPKVKVDHQNLFLKKSSSLSDQATTN